MTFPRYVLRTDAGEFVPCDTLVGAFDLRAKRGGIVYEPLGMAAAERIHAEAPRLYCDACGYALNPDGVCTRPECCNAD